MVDSYAWGAQGGILQGAADLTGALLGYPLALDKARRDRAMQEQQQAELERQHRRQDVADAFVLEDRARKQKEQMFADLYAGRMEPEGLHPEMPLSTPEQFEWARGMKERDLKQRATEAQITAAESLAGARDAQATAREARAAGTGAGTGKPKGRSLSYDQALQEAADILGDISDTDTDAEGNPLPSRQLRIRMLAEELMVVGNPPAAGAAQAFTPAPPAAEAFMPPVARPSPRVPGTPLRGPRAARSPAAAPAQSFAPPQDMQARAELTNAAQPLLVAALQRYDAGDDEGMRQILEQSGEAPQVVAEAVRMLERIMETRAPRMLPPITSGITTSLSGATSPEDIEAAWRVAGTGR